MEKFVIEGGDIRAAKERAIEQLLDGGGCEADLVMTAETTQIQPWGGGAITDAFRFDNRRTGAAALFHHEDTERDGRLWMLTADEIEPANWLTAFRRTPVERTPHLIDWLGARVVRPTAAADISAPLSHSALDTVNGYFGKRDWRVRRSHILERHGRRDTAFRSQGTDRVAGSTVDCFGWHAPAESPRGLTFMAALLPVDLLEVNGLFAGSIFTIDDYTDAVCSWLGMEMTAEQRGAVRDAYIKMAGDVLIRHAAYEICRTGSYAEGRRLVENLPSAMALPDGWWMRLWGGECGGLLWDEGAEVLTADVMAFSFYARLAVRATEMTLYSSAFDWWRMAGAVDAVAEMTGASAKLVRAAVAYRENDESRAFHNYFN